MAEIPSPERLRASTSRLSASEERVLGELDHGERTQAQLARATGMSAAAISYMVDRLADAGIVRRESGVRNGKRVNIVVRSERTHRGIVCVALAQQVRVAVWDVSGAARRRDLEDHFHAVAGDDVPEFEIRLQNLVRTFGAIEQLTVGVPGWRPPPPPGIQTRPSPPNYPFKSWLEPGLEDRLSGGLDVPVVFANDSKLAAVGEHAWGAAKKFETFMYVNLSEGVGGALFQHGRLVLGDTGDAGELGHLSDPDVGKYCWCGGRGCLESQIGEAAMLDALRSLYGVLDVTSMSQIVSAALDGDEHARRIVASAGADAGRVVSSLVQFLDVGKVVVGGTLAHTGETVLAPMRRELLRGIGHHRVQGLLVAGSLGADAVVAGGLSYGAERLEGREMPAFSF